MTHDHTTSASGRTARHLVLGAGAVGSGTAAHLADCGHEVTVVTRSGTGPSHEGIELVAADAGDRRRLAELAIGAETIYNCVNPKYSAWATDWPPLHASMVAAAESSGARLVITGNLYGYPAGSSPMSATDPLEPPARNGEVRAAMWHDALAAHDAGRIQATEIRASDFFGPSSGTAHMGDRVVPRVLAGKSASMVGDVDQPHSWTYIGDVCDALVALGNDDRAFGRAWHVPTGPPLTARQLIDGLTDAAGLQRVKVKQMPRNVLRLAARCMPDLAAVLELTYQFDEPFVIDAAETTRVFGLEPTPLAEQYRATIEAHRLTEG